MFLKSIITEIFTETLQRYFQANLVARQTSKLVQFDSGGEDYCPLADTEGLTEFIGNNPRNGVVFAWRDGWTRKCAEGEKRLYSLSTDEDGEIIQKAEVYLKNDGSIEINGNASIIIDAAGNITATSSGTVTITGTSINLGGKGGGLVLTENSTILDSSGGSCTITPNTSVTKAV